MAPGDVDPAAGIASRAPVPGPDCGMPAQDSVVMRARAKRSSDRAMTAMPSIVP